MEQELTTEKKIEIKQKVLFIFGCLIVFVGTFPIFMQLPTLIKINGEILMGIGTLVIIFSESYK